jgi:hypothetical protein
VPVLYDSHGLKVYESYKMGDLPLANRPFYMFIDLLISLEGTQRKRGNAVDIPPYFNEILYEYFAVKNDNT